MTTTEPTHLTGQYILDPAHTRIGFVTRHAMVTKVRGAFTDFTGTASLDADQPDRSAVSVTIEAASIDTRNPDRDGHLRSGDFLDVEQHPQIRFVSTQTRWTGAETVEITGELTIKDVTRPVTVPFTFDGQAVDPFGNTRIGFDGSTTINRQDFGVTFNAPLETGGVLIGDQVTLEFEISAIKQT